MPLRKIIWLLVAVIGTGSVLGGPLPETTYHSTSTKTESVASPTSGDGAGSCFLAAGPATSLSIPSSVPSNSAKVPGDFIGFGFETAFLNNYANSFSENLVTSVQKRLGSPIIIRVGGTTGDTLVYNPDQSKAAVCLNGDCPVGSTASYSLGPSYFNGFKSFPKQQFSFQAPLSTPLNLTGSVEYAKNAYQAIGGNRVAAIAIGNEVDLHVGEYTIQNYVSDAHRLEAAVRTATGAAGRIFEVLDLSGGDNSTNGFTVQSAFQNGIDRANNVKFVAAHWYQVPTTEHTFDPTTLQQDLLSHSAITSLFSQSYAAGVQYVAANEPDVSYVISESGSSLFYPPENFQDGFGAALWEADFYLYAASVGIARVDGTQRPASGHALWVPDTSTNSASLGDEQNTGPQVRAPYFAIPFVADFLSANPGAIVELLGADTLTAYAIYDSSGSVARAALINLNYWSSDTGGTRNNQTFIVPAGGLRTATVQYLRANNGAHALGYDADGSFITWAGETWSYSLDNGNGHLVSGVPVHSNVTACDGAFHISLEDSSAAIVYFGGSS